MYYKSLRGHILSSDIIHFHSPPPLPSSTISHGDDNDDDDDLSFILHPQLS